MTSVHIHYFGEIAEKTDKTSETIELKSLNTQTLLDYLHSTYNIPSKGIQIAVNQELVKGKEALKPTDEIAILSPFAGG